MSRATMKTRSDVALAGSVRTGSGDDAAGAHGDPATGRLRDRRYRIRREYCGYDKPRHVVRFCDVWLGQSASRAGALAIARCHAIVHQARLALARAEADLALALVRDR